MMSLSSLVYIIFLLVVFVLYYALPHRFRWVLLLAASYFFYLTWQPLYALLLLSSTGVAYAFGRMLRSKDRRGLLILGIALLLLPLFFFKYYAFLNQNLSLVMATVGWVNFLPGYSFLLPVGISFYTFQAISYLVDVWRGYLKPEKHFGLFALYLAFFPTLSAGPIERAKSMLGQFKTPQVFRYDEAVAGLQLIGWGLFKKLVIANHIVGLIDPVFAQPDAYGGLLLYLTLILSPFQIFCDFSGYSDIAIGSGRLLGFRLTKNFDDRVYAATSRIQFWQGWHKSLTTWFRDYVYFPLGKRMPTRRGLYLTLLIIYFLTGLWHGASWGFILWGLTNGIWLVGEHWSKERRKAVFSRIWPDLNAPLHRLLSTLLVFHVGAMMGVFLRTQTFAGAMVYYRQLFAWPNGSLNGEWGYVKPVLIFVGLLVMDGVNRWLDGREISDLLATRDPIWRWSFYIALCVLILTLGRTDRLDFFYYQF